MKKLLVFILTIIFFFSCNSIHVENQLNEIETYISERPDSALAVLDSLDRNLLTTQKTRSHHALLHAMALDKNYIDVSDDSLALTALGYYDRHGDRKYKARALYYLGLSYYYSKEYDKAIIEFTKAEEVAQKHDSLYWGMTKVAQADTYAHTYNDFEEYNNIRKAYDIYASISNDYYLTAIKLRMARSYANIGKYAQSDSLLLEVFNTNNVDFKVLSSALIDYAYSMVIRNDKNLPLAADLYSKAFSDYDISFFSTKDYWAWAYSLERVGRKHESIELIDQLKILDTNIISEYWQYVIAKENSDYLSALLHLEETTKMNEEEVMKALKQELSLKQRDYYFLQSELSFYKMRVRTVLLASIILITLMTIGYLVILYRGYIKRQQEEKEKYMEYIAEITRQLDSIKNDDKDSLKKKYIGLYKSKFEVLRLLSDQYLLTENRVDAEDKMYRKVISLVNEIRNDEDNRAKFEAMLDNDLDMIMTRIRTEMPKMKELDYAIFRYLIIGFDATTISRLLNTSLNIIYIRKTRMKQHIKDKSPEHMEQFLEMIS